MKHEIKTINGYCFFEVSSAFQKSIRRGQEDDALFWMVELSLSNFNEYIWKRLKIMVSEDVGFAEPELPILVSSLYSSWKDLAKKKDEKHTPERLFITHAVIALVRAKKSRYVDWITIHAFGCHSERFRPIPDFALDMHTRKGKALGRGLKHFLEDGAKLENHHPEPKEEEAEQLGTKALTGSCTSLFD